MIVPGDTDLVCLETCEVEVVDEDSKLWRQILEAIKGGFFVCLLELGDEIDLVRSTGNRDVAGLAKAAQFSDCAFLVLEETAVVADEEVVLALGSHFVGCALDVADHRHDLVGTLLCLTGAKRRKLMPVGVELPVVVWAVAGWSETGWLVLHHYGSVRVTSRLVVVGDVWKESLGRVEFVQKQK